jgi:C_GCAxxG_C_C family probable redox protein
LLAVGGHLFEDLSEREIRMSSGFAAGIGSTKLDACGAFSAGVMLIGAAAGRVDPDVDDSRCQELVREYRDRFLDRFEFINCGELREEKFGSGGAEPCSALVERAARELLLILEDEV